MEAFLEEFQNLKRFNLKEIKSITGDFDKNNLIGEGGFGKVYGGVVSQSNGQIMAAFKRLDRNCGQGNSEFLKEITMLSRYTLENLISLLGFCDEKGEKILVYKHASRGSLDGHLSSTTLTWTLRLKICLGAARGLSYLHDPKGTHERVIHRDIKSSNILLDGNWIAKVSDMGLSKMGPANQVQSILATNVAGTCFYIDPEYMETSLLTKESDVYSFGVVLLEVLCGSLCYANKNGRYQRLVRWWIKCYEEKKLEEIIFHHLKQDMKLRSLETFSEIAYGCLHTSRAQRPNMSQVVEKLEIALHFQQEVSKVELEEMVKAAVNIEDLEMLLSNTFPNNESSKLEFEEIIQNALKIKELHMLLSERSLNKEMSKMELEEILEVVVNKEALEMLLSKRFFNKEEQELFLLTGILVNRGKTWFKSNKKGEHCEMISGFTSTIPHDDSFIIRNVDVNNSRFKLNRQDVLYKSFKTHAIPQFLSPGITYTVHLVFKLESTRKQYKYLKYKFAEEEIFSTSFVLHEREDGWMMTDQLCHFICSDKENINLEITFDCEVPMLIEGIQIQSHIKVQHEQVLEEEEVDTHPDTYWEQKLPNDWETILLRSSKDILQWKTKKDLYFILRKGFLINDSEEWFSLANNTKICHMLSARRALSNPAGCAWKSIPDSRFGVTTYDLNRSFDMNCRSIMLSPQTKYAAYFVYKLQESDDEKLRRRVKVNTKITHNGQDSIVCHIYLLIHQPTVIRGKVYQKKRVPQQRNDGWMEVPVWEFETDTDTESRIISVKFEFSRNLFTGTGSIMMEGIEFRPI